MFALREVRATVLQQRDVVDERVADAGPGVRALFGPARHPRVIDRHRHTLAPPLVGAQLARAVPIFPEVVLRPRDPAERVVGPRQLGSRERRAREARRALESSDTEVRIRDQLIAERTASALCDVALSLEIGRRFIEAAPVSLDVVAAAADVAGLEGNPP